MIDFAVEFLKPFHTLSHADVVDCCKVLFELAFQQLVVRQHCKFCHANQVVLAFYEGKIYAESLNFARSIP